jgi:hypothetical protein
MSLLSSALSRVQRRILNDKDYFPGNIKPETEIMLAVLAQIFIHFGHSINNMTTTTENE